jgi:hypothetical protein
MKNQSKPKMYIVRKYVMAKDCKDALRQERSIPVHDVFIDQQWSDGQVVNLADAIGFEYGKL